MCDALRPDVYTVLLNSSYSIAEIEQTLLFYG